MGSGSRGSGEKSVGALTRKHASTEEVRAILQAVDEGLAPAAAAILMTACVEQHLEIILRRQMKRHDEATWKTLTKDGGPLGTLSRKIELAYAMKLFDSEIKSNLESLKSIRNAFAHAKMIIDFDNEVVVEQLRQVAPPASNIRDKHRIGAIRLVKKYASAHPRQAFRCLASMLIILLLERSLRGLSAAARNRARPTSRLKGFMFGKPWKSLGPGTGIGLSWRPHQVSDPTHPSPKEDQSTPAQSSKDGDRSKGR